MKKFKLFVLAVFAMLSTNVFAAFEAYEDANTIFRFKVTAPYSATPTETLGEATIIGFVADYTGFATTEIPAIVNGATKGGKFKVTAIGIEGAETGAFEGKAITTLDLSAAENLEVIEANAFKGTSITTLDLSATKVKVVKQWFETTNTKVTTIKLPKTLTTIGENAFNGLSALNSITFAEQSGDDVYGLTIGGDAFVNTMALTTLTLPANVTSIANKAFEKTYLTELTINGDVPATGVAAGAFAKNGTQTLTVNYNPSSDGENKTSFSQEAFAAADAKAWVTFVTTTHYGETTLAELTKDAEGNVLYGAKLSFTPTGLAKIKVYNQGGTYSYGTFTVATEGATSGISIAKKQDSGNVMVYGAYTDDTNPVAVLMDQLHLIGGKYYIPKGASIIVKSSGTADVEYEVIENLDGKDSQHYKKSTTTTTNEIKVYGGADTYAVNVTPVEAGKDYIIFLKPLDETTFGWAEFTENRVVKKGQFYLEAKAPAAAGVRVIWLDGSEEDQVTAIKTVKCAKAENGAIYNLAGQKVNAAYKGVVIKDGKKYIQK